MAVYVDPALQNWRDRAWAHLVADDVDELHAFARKLGLKREWFQDPYRCGNRIPHYDITASVRTDALRLGAVSLTRRQFGEWIRQRFPRDGEKEALCDSSRGNA